MKRAILFFVISCFALATLSGGPLRQDKDLAAVMKVVQRAEASTSAQPIPPRQEKAEASVIKLLIQDGHDGEKISLSFPLSWVEWLAEMDEDKTLDDWTGDDDIKLKDVLKMLKSLGATELIEIKDKDSLVRIWLE